MLELKLKNGKEIHFYALNSNALGKLYFFYSCNKLPKQCVVGRAVSLGIIQDLEKDKFTFIEFSVQQIMHNLSPMSGIINLDVKYDMLGIVMDEFFNNYDAQKHWEM